MIEWIAEEMVLPMHYSWLLTNMRFMCNVSLIGFVDLLIMYIENIISPIKNTNNIDTVYDIDTASRDS